MRVEAATLALALGLSAAFAGATAAVALARPAALDAVALYAGARLVATGHGAALVDPDAVLAAEREAAPERGALLPFVQPPAVALILAPVARLPYADAYPLMVAFEGLALVAAGLLLVPRRARRPPMLAAFVLLAPPCAVALAEAQTSPLVMLLVAWAARAGPHASGFALGATLLRPQVAPLLILAGLIDPSRRAATALGAFAVVAVSAGVVGIDGLGRYAAVLAGAGAWSVTGEHGLRASIGWAGPAIALGGGGLGLAASIASLVVGGVVVIRARPDARIRAAGAWSLLGSPHVLLHDAVLALPALATITARAPVAALLAAAGWIAHATVAPVGIAVSVGTALASARGGIDDARLRDPDHR